MAKRIIKITLITLGIGIFLFLVYLNYNSFIDTTKRLADILDIHNLKNFIEKYNSKRNIIYDESIKEIEDAIGGVIDNITEVTQKPFGELLGETLLNLLDFTSNLLIYFCNYGLNIIILAYIFFHETITGTQLALKTSPPARLYLLIIKSIDKLKELIKKALKKLKNYIYQERRKLALIIVLYLLSNGILYKILVEVLIFFITYIIRMINLETYLLVFSILQAIFTFTYPKLKYIPLWILIPLLFVALFFKAISKANYKLRKNHKRLKEFAKEDLTQTTFINGPPGTGKTLLNVSLSLASEENFIDELERKMLEFEQKYKYVNFAKIRADYKNYEEGFFKEYINWYKKLYFRQSFIISNFTIYDPIFDDNSKIWDFKYMRKNIPTDIYPLEEYIVISISEFDKEYNSHDNKKEVGEEGAHIFFSTVSHDLKRNVKLFVDYQLKDQVPLRIRGNAEYFITLKKRKKKYPFLLFIYYLPIKALNKFILLLISKYEKKKKKLGRASSRNALSNFKRNDITLLYAILRNMSYTLGKINKWFEQFYYFKINVILSNDDGENAKPKDLYINFRDLEYKNKKLYDSTFLSFAYNEKHNFEFKDLDKFKSLTPSIDELKKCHSRAYDSFISYSQNDIE